MPGPSVDTSTFCDACAAAWAHMHALTVPPHECTALLGCDCLASHSLIMEEDPAPPAARLPRYDGRGCSWTGDPAWCLVHNAEMVLVPMTHSTGGTGIRMCRVLLSQAASAPTPEPPRPTVVDQLAQRMNTAVNQRGPSENNNEAARRALAALPALDDTTVDALAVVTLFADHPLHPGEGNWETVPPYVRRRWHIRVRALLNELAKAADQ